MLAPVSPPSDPLLDEAARLLEELRDRCAAPDLGSGAEELLIGGYASALALEGARRRLRAQALELSERELSLATQERELRALLRTLQGRIREPAVTDEAGSHDEPAPQRLH
jgi:cobalamin biosynthesis Mg chelatase CobN